jgi:aldose 1-epimerase
MEVDLCDYGAMVTSVRVPDRDGRTVDVVLGFDTVEEYPEKSQYFGCSVGRVGNRIAGGTFELEGATYELARNNAPNHLHGGDRGFDKHVWDATEIFTTKGPGIRFTRTSPDGEEGYPGTLAAEIVYLLTEKNELIVDMTATAERPRPVIWFITPTGISVGTTRGPFSTMFWSSERSVTRRSTTR